MDQYKVMIVDDSPLMRSLFKELIDNDPLLCVSGLAEDGAQARKQLDESQPDVILLDLEMPVWDGLNFLRHYRSHTDAKIIVLSAVVDGKKKPIGNAAERYGADAVIAKPSGGQEEMGKDAGQSVLKTVYELLGI